MIADLDPDSNPNPEKVRYIVIDEETGQPKTIVENNTNSYQYTFEGPVVYTTESDYYGNQGYFILSNLTLVITGCGTRCRRDTTSIRLPHGNLASQRQGSRFTVTERSSIMV